MRNCCADGAGHGGRPRGLAGHRVDAPSHAAHQAPPVWRVPEGPEGLAAVPVGGGRAWPQHPRVTAITTPAKVAHNFRRSFFETAQKRCNSNEAISMFEQLAGELRAKLMGERPVEPQAARQGAQSNPARQGTRSKTSGTGRRHDPRLGRQGTQPLNPQGVRNVGGAPRPGHSQRGADKRHDLLGGPAQAS